MTDSLPDPGWWLASDGNWYPPQLHADALDRASDIDRVSFGGSESAAAGRSSGVASGTGTSTRTAESDAEILAAFHVTSDGEPGDIGDIGETTRGRIDWEAVARERAAQREMRTRQAGASRRKIYAVGGAVITLLAIALIVLIGRGGDDDRSRTQTTPDVATTSPAASNPTPTSAVDANVSVFSLAPGSCIDQNDLTTGLVTTVKSVPCDQPHSHEVYFKTSVTPADQAYDPAKVTIFANQACAQGFLAYVGLAYEQSKYYFLHLAPSAESWNKNSDRDVVCLLLLEGQKLTSSVKGKKE